MPERWPVFRGDNSIHDGILELPAPPPWRDFGAQRRTGDPYVIDAETRDRVNAALYLRRPLLVTGLPGSGKSALAYAVARELGLGPVLHWPINSRTTIQDGLYQYDGLGRLQESTPRGEPLAPLGAADYVTLGPLGTALHSDDTARPRVLLIDEFDKGDADLAFDLLNVLEEGTFRIPELERGASGPSTVSVATADPGERTEVENASVRCNVFPFIVLTSNGYREFPPALLRRCVRVTLPEPTREQLAKIIELHLGVSTESNAYVSALVERFVQLRSNGLLATDQLLNAVYLAVSGVTENQWSATQLADLAMQDLGAPE